MQSVLAEKVRYLVSTYLNADGDLRFLAKQTGVAYTTLYRIYHDQNERSYDAAKLEAVYRYLSGHELEIR